MEDKVLSELLLIKKIELVYPNSRRITVKRFPTSDEIKEKKYLRSQMIEVKEITSHNELDINLYNKKEQDSVKVISGGLIDFNEKIPSGAYIDIKMKCADKDLTTDINDIVRELSKKYLKPCICFPGRYTTQAKVDNCLFTEQIAIAFYEEFANEIKKKVEYYPLQEKAKPKISKDEYITYKPKSFWKRLFGK